MGSCLSKKSTICSSPSALPDPSVQSRINPQVTEKRRAEEETLKKEIFVIKHRRSHNVDRRSEEEKSILDRKISEAADAGNCSSNGGFPNGGIAVRTSSCTKEEVDAILIQCGRLSRSSSAGKAAVSGSGGSCDNEVTYRRGRKYSGSKRSYDFDQETSNSDKDKKNSVGFGDGSYDNDDAIDGGDDETVAERIHRHRQRQYRPSSSSSSRRRTPSRERDQPPLQQHRSGSRERGGSGGRRVSRSPGRRSESPIPGAAPSTANSSGNNPSRPGKMVSVPATVSSLAIDKTNNGTAVDPPFSAAIKRISVKRNAGDPAMVCRSAASPRSRSPARANPRASSENQNPHSNQPLSLSRSNSRKAEQSPYRRNPLNEIDQNCMGFEPSLPGNKSSNNIPSQMPKVENVRTNKVTAQGTLENRDWSISYRENDQPMDEDGKGLPPMESESLKPQMITRSRSPRLSRDLEFKPETLPNPPPSSYTALLLEDIQNFHQKSSAPAISLPPCVTKACSILEAVADLNSGSSSNLPGVILDDRRNKAALEQFKKKRFEAKDPLVESEVVVCDDLMEPSFHKYVTVRRGGTMGGGGDVEEQESSGSNGFAGSQQHWVSSSLLEHNSADSIEQGRRLGEKKERESDQQRIGIGRGKVGSGRGLHSIPPALAAA